MRVVGCRQACVSFERQKVSESTHVPPSAATSQVSQQAPFNTQYEEGTTPVTMTAAAAERALQRRA